MAEQTKSKVEVASSTDQIETRAGSAPSVWADVRLHSNKANIRLSGIIKIDGMSPIEGDRILVSAQDNKTENGIYTVVDNGYWSRENDATKPGCFEHGKVVSVVDGNTEAGRKYSYAGVDDPNIGTADITFEEVQSSLRATTENTNNSNPTQTVGGSSNGGDSARNTMGFGIRVFAFAMGASLLGIAVLPWLMNSKSGSTTELLLVFFASTLFVLSGVFAVCLFFSLVHRTESSGVNVGFARYFLAPHFFRMLGIFLIAAIFLITVWVLLLANPFLEFRRAATGNGDAAVPGNDVTKSEEKFRTNNITSCSFRFQEEQVSESETTIQKSDADQTSGIGDIEDAFLEGGNVANTRSEDELANSDSVNSQEAQGENRRDNDAGFDEHSNSSIAISQGIEIQDQNTESPEMKPSSELKREFSEREARVWSYAIFAACLVFVFGLSVFTIGKCVFDE